MPQQVFLSYSTKDTAATEAVCRYLEAKGIRCWMAPRDIPVGHDWAEAIISALNRCPVMVLIYSSNANASMQVTREVQRAFEKGLAVFPFRLEAVQPNPGLEYYLGSVHWLDALTPPLESHMDKLGEAVSGALARYARGEPPVAPLSTVPAHAAGKARAFTEPGRGGNRGGLIVAAMVGFLALGGGAWWMKRSSPVVADAAKPVVGSAPAVADSSPSLPPAPSVVEDAPPAGPVAVAEPTPEPTPAPELSLPSATTPAEATAELPWRDGFNRAYLPVVGTEVLFAIWPTKVEDYERFARATDTEWPAPNFDQSAEHPAVNITWNEAQAYCEWLNGHEQSAGRLPSGYHYRLPTVAEWDRAVGLDGALSPEEWKEHFPWGKAWPPPKGSGNYAEALEADAFSHTSPVGSFSPNRFGLYDMAGNVWQWCAEEPGPDYRTARGGSWMSGTPRELSIGGRINVGPVYRNASYGFRCVLAPVE